MPQSQESLVDSAVRTGAIELCTFMDNGGSGYVWLEYHSDVIIQAVRDGASVESANTASRLLAVTAYHAATKVCPQHRNQIAMSLQQVVEHITVEE